MRISGDKSQRSYSYNYRLVLKPIDASYTISKFHLRDVLYSKRTPIFNIKATSHFGDIEGFGYTVYVEKVNFKMQEI